MTDVFATGRPALSTILPVTTVGLCACARADDPSVSTRPAMPANCMRDILAMFPTSRGLGGCNDWTGIDAAARGDNDFVGTTSCANCCLQNAECHRGLSRL